MSEQGYAPKVERLLSDLQDALDHGAIAVVEGPSDEKALRSLGVRGNIAQLSRKPYSELAEGIAGKASKAIILTDFDRYGEKAAKGLRNSFSNECIAADLSFRARLKALLGYVELEDIPSLIENKIGSDVRWEKHI